MAGIDRHIKHYRTNHDTGEKILNTDLNICIILNGLSYIAMLVLVFTVGAFGAVSSTTQLLSTAFQTLVTIDGVFFKVIWSFILIWQGFWAVWQIANPSERNCEGVVRAAYWYPVCTFLYAGYTILCRFRMFIAGCIFCFCLCGCLVALVMSMQKYRAKIWKGYFLWQGPLSLYAAWIMVETMLIFNAIFVRLDEDFIIKTSIAGISLLVIFFTAIAWLSSYPVDFLIPLVLMLALGAMYLELENDLSHYGNLIRQDYSTTLISGWKYGVLVLFILIAIALVVKLFVVIFYHRPMDQDERKKKKENRVSVSITIDTGNNDNNNKKKSNKNRNNDRQWNDNRRAPPDEYADDYYGNNYDNEYGNYDDGYGNHYDDGYHNGYDDSYRNDNRRQHDYNNNYHSPPSTPVQKPKKKSSKNFRSDPQTPRQTPRSSTKRSVTMSPKTPNRSPRKGSTKSPRPKTTMSPKTPMKSPGSKKVSTKSLKSPAETPRTKKKKKAKGPKSPKQETSKTSATSIDDDSME